MFYFYNFLKQFTDYFNNLITNISFFCSRSMTSNFDEKSGVIYCKTSWGNWYQTVNEVVLEIICEPGTKGTWIKSILFSRNYTLIGLMYYVVPYIESVNASLLFNV